MLHTSLFTDHVYCLSPSTTVWVPWQQWFLSTVPSVLHFQHSKHYMVHSTHTIKTCRMKKWCLFLRSWLRSKQLALFNQQSISRAPSLNLPKGSSSLGIFFTSAGVSLFSKSVSSGIPKKFTPLFCCEGFVLVSGFSVPHKSFRVWSSEQTLPGWSKL